MIQVQNDRFFMTADQGGEIKIWNQNTNKFVYSLNQQISLCKATSFKSSKLKSVFLSDSVQKRLCKYFSLQTKRPVQTRQYQLS